MNKIIYKLPSQVQPNDNAIYDKYTSFKSVSLYKSLYCSLFKLKILLKTHEKSNYKKVKTCLIIS